MIVEAKQGEVTTLGRLGENEARTVRFQVRDVLEEHPDAVITLLNRRPGDATAYPVPSGNVRIQDGYLYWTVTSGDLTKRGNGECEMIATEGGAICKSVYYETKILSALDGSGTVPEPWTGWVQQVTDAAGRAEAAAALLEHPGAEAETLEPGSQATASYADGVFSFGLVKGDKGDDGDPGQDGHTPVIAGSKTGKTSTITADGVTIATILDGDDGDPGQDGHTPVIAGSKTGKTSTITADGETIATILDGEDGDPAALIDDTAGEGDTDKVWSADKLDDTVSNLNTAIGEKYTKPDTGIPATDLASGVIPSVPVTDVQINGSSILSQGVANVPVASANALGAVKIDSYYGVAANSAGRLSVSAADVSRIKLGDKSVANVTASNQHAAVFYGLAKAANADMASVSGATVGVYPEAQRIAIQKMLGIYEAPYELVNDITLETESRIELTADSNGTPYNLLSIYIFVSYPANLTAPTDGFGRFRFYDDSDNYVASETGRYTGSTSACNKAICLIKKGNMTTCNFTRIVGNGSYANWYTKSLNTPSTRFDMGNITKILTPSNDTEPAGTNIKIYAQRAY